MWPVEVASWPVKPGQGVERAVGTDRVRVLHVHVARAVVDAVVRREAVARGLLAQERHLVVEEIAVVAPRAGAGADRGHAGAVQRLARSR